MDSGSTAASFFSIDILSSAGMRYLMINRHKMELGYQKIDKYDEQCVSEMAAHYKEILRLLGEDPEREGLLKSPERIAKAPYGSLCGQSSCGIYS